MRDNSKFKPGQTCKNRNRMDRKTKSINGNSKEKRRGKLIVNPNNIRRRYMCREGKFGERRIIQEV